MTSRFFRLLFSSKSHPCFNNNCSICKVRWPSGSFSKKNVVLVQKQLCNLLLFHSRMCWAVFSHWRQQTCLCAIHNLQSQSVKPWIWIGSNSEHPWLGVRNSSINTRFHPILIRWNQGLTWNFPNLWYTRDAYDTSNKLETDNLAIGSIGICNDIYRRPDWFNTRNSMSYIYIDFCVHPGFHPTAASDLNVKTDKRWPWPPSIQGRYISWFGQVDL